MKKWKLEKDPSDSQRMRGKGIDTEKAPSFQVKKMGKRLSLYKNSAFRGVKWERGDVMIEVLNKTTFAF